MSGRLHVVGAGVAGLAAALAASRSGRPVSLYEAAPQAGGRARTVESEGFVHDNGTHVLLAANRAVFALLDETGARERWVEPEPAGLPVWDAAAGRLRLVGLSPWDWRRRSLRPDGVRPRDILALAAFAAPGRDSAVGAAFPPGPFREGFVEPLTVAVMNTGVNEASSKRLGRALRRLAAPGAARLFVAREGLGPDLVSPALRTLAGRGASLTMGLRLRDLAREADGRVSALVFAGETVPVPPEDRIVLALPPAEVSRLTGLADLPSRYEPILNLHVALAGPAQPRFVGLTGTLAQWVLVRGDHCSVTVSAAGRDAGDPAPVLADRIWREVRPALTALGFSVPEPLPHHRLVKEKRATLHQGVGIERPRLPLPRGLAVAGDWMSDLPATLESAALSGREAVAHLF